MGLPNIPYAGQTSPQMVELDQTFAAVGALTVIPAMIVGTNAITVSPLANTPAIPAYADYNLFGGIAGGTNTGATTANVNALGSLQVYKDGPTGPVALVGGEIVGGNYIVLAYDGTLNSGAGGFHLQASINVGVFSSITVSGSVSVGTSLTVAGSASIVGIETVGSLVVGVGHTPVTRVVSATGSLTWSVVAAGAAQDQTIAVSGAAVNDVVMLGPPSVVSAGIAYEARVSAAGVVSVRASNTTSVTVVPAAGTFRAAVMGFT